VADIRPSKIEYLGARVPLTAEKGEKLTNQYLSTMQATNNVTNNMDNVEKIVDLTINELNAYRLAAYSQQLVDTKYDEKFRNYIRHDIYERCNAELYTRNKELFEENEALKRQIEAMQTGEDHSAGCNAEMEKEIKLLKRKIAKMQVKKGVAIKDFNEKDTEAEKSKANLEQAIQSAKDVSAKLEAAQKKISALEEEIRRYEGELQKAGSDLTKCESGRRSDKSAMEKAKAAMDSQVKKINELESKLRESDSKYIELKHKFDSVCKDRAQIHEEDKKAFKEMEATAETRKKMLEESEKERKDLKEKLKMAEDTCKQWNSWYEKDILKLDEQPQAEAQPEQAEEQAEEQVKDVLGDSVTIDWGNEDESEREETQRQQKQYFRSNDRPTNKYRGSSYRSNQRGRGSSREQNRPSYTRNTNTQRKWTDNGTSLTQQPKQYTQDKGKERVNEFPVVLENAGIRTLDMLRGSRMQWGYLCRRTPKKYNMDVDAYATDLNLRNHLEGMEAEVILNEIPIEIAQKADRGAMTGQEPEKMLKSVLVLMIMKTATEDTTHEEATFLVGEMNRTQVVKRLKEEGVITRA
jgi:DNA repair exonuclease SbcCD ATPase subunit